MRKSELVELLQSLDIAVNEGLSSDKNKNVYPRIVFWDYLWDDVVGSGDAYSTVETYQISFYSNTPRHPKLIELRDKLREAGEHVLIYHEFNQEEKVFHSYFQLDCVVDE